MSQIVTWCGYCMEVIPEGQFACEKCRDEYTVASQETRIVLGDITYSRRDVELSPTGKELKARGHIGRRAIACEHMPDELQDQIRNFVLGAESSYRQEKRDTGTGDEAGR